MDVKTVIDSVKDLSPTPKILPKLQALLRDPESGIDDVIALIKKDAPLTAQIVRLSNSAAFAFTAPSTDLEGAVSCLGFQEVYKVVGVVATGQILGRASPVYKLEAGELWGHSLYTAVVMAQLASHAGLEPNSAYTLGLLHSIGKIVINSYFLDKGIEIYSDEDGENIIPDLERQLIGFDHAQASAGLMRKWVFPEEACIPIEHYPYPLKSPEFKERACLLYVAAEAAKYIKANPEATSFDVPVEADVLEAAGLSGFTLQDSLFEAQDSLREVQEFMTA